MSENVRLTFHRQRGKLSADHNGVRLIIHAMDEHRVLEGTPTWVAVQDGINMPDVLDPNLASTLEAQWALAHTAPAEPSHHPDISTQGAMGHREETDRLPSRSVPVQVPAAEPPLGDDLEPPRPLARETERVAIFVDAMNVENGFWIDWENFSSLLAGKAERVQGHYFTSLIPTNLDGYTRYLDRLNLLGFLVKYEPAKWIDDDTYPQGGFYKGNMDVQITLAMISAIDHYDVAILVSGDGDFVPLVQYLQHRGKRVHVVSRAKQLAVDLRRVSNWPAFTIEQLRPWIEFYRPYFTEPFETAAPER